MKRALILLLLVATPLFAQSRRRSVRIGDAVSTFVFDHGNVLGDDDAGGGPNSFVDEKTLRLPDGRLRLRDSQQSHASRVADIT